MRFTNRSKYIVIVRDKFYLVSYNVLALCEAEYLYSFIFSSLKIEYPKLSANPVDDVLSAINSLDLFIIVII